MHLSFSLLLDAFSTTSHLHRDFLMLFVPTCLHREFGSSACQGGGFARSTRSHVTRFSLHAPESAVGNQGLAYYGQRAKKKWPRFSTTTTWRTSGLRSLEISRQIHVFQDVLRVTKTLDHFYLDSSKNFTKFHSHRFYATSSSCGIDIFLFFLVFVSFLRSLIGQMIKSIICNVVMGKRVRESSS